MEEPAISNDDLYVPWAKVRRFYGWLVVGLIGLYIVVRVGGNLFHTFHTDMSAERVRWILADKFPVGTPANDVITYFRETGVEFAPRVHVDWLDGDSRWVIAGVRDGWWNLSIFEPFIEIRIRLDEQDQVISISATKSYTFL